MSTSAENSPPKQEERTDETAQQTSSSAQGQRSEDKSRFECHICLESAQDPVVTRCGHLYCWPCLHTWIQTRSHNPLCPVCKSVVNKDEVTPIYGKSGDNVDPRTKTIPPRPQGQRTEDPNGGQGAGANPFGFPWDFQQNGVQANVHFSFGVGLFPFSLITTFFNGNNANMNPNGDQDQLAADTNLLSNLFLGIGCAFILWLIFT